MTKLLAFGDIHLGAGAEYGRKPGDRLRDQAAVLEQIADLAIEEAVDGILCAGDVFEGPGVPPEQLDVFASFIDRLQDRVPLLVTLGNGRHDAALRDVNGLAIFNRFYNVQVVSRPEVVEFAGCAVACLPWVHLGRLIAQLGGDVGRDEVNATAAELLIEIAEGLYANAGTGRPRILLGHWHTDVALDANGNGIAQFAHEPILSYVDLHAIGFDYVVLGHNHRQQTFATTSFHPGSPMCLNFGEQDLPHGVAIIDTDDEHPVRFESICSPPFVTIEYADADTFLSRCFENTSEVVDGSLQDAIVRVRYRATREEQRHIDAAYVRRTLLDAGAAVVKIQPDIVREQRARVEGVDEQLDELAALELYLAANEVDETLAGRMRDRTRDWLGAAA